MNISHLKYYKIINIVFLFSFYCLRAQVSPEDVKATLILHFCENIEWAKPFNGNFIIGCYADNSKIYSILKSTENQIKIQGKSVKFQNLTSFNDFTSCHAVYFNKENLKDYTSIFDLVRNNNILLITDNFKDPLFIYINLIDNKGQIAFKINMPNLTLAGFNVKQNILLNGGSVVDIKKAYENFENQLNESRNKLEKSELLLMQNEELLKEKDNTIKNKELEVQKYLGWIQKYKLESDSLEYQVNSERLFLKQKDKEIYQKDQDLKKIHREIEKKHKELSNIREEVYKYQKTSDTLRFEINEKSIKLNQQDDLISAQQRFLIVMFVLVISLFITGFALYRLFTLNKKNVVLLAQKVDERTKELKFSNEQYQALFNLAPVALWETDFTEVLNYINSLKLNTIDDYDFYIKENPQFLLECIKRIHFININLAALGLFKIENKDELIDIYHQAYSKGALNELLPDFKFLFSGKLYHTYEATRYSKKNDRIELIITMSDISNVSGSYSRVIISLVDVTRLRIIEKELIKHQNELELLVKVKTEDLETVNEELRATNEELYTKGQIINEQNIELKNILKNLKETQSQLIQSEKMASLGVLTAGVAHEINNPLNFILGAYEGLKVTLCKISENKYEQQCLTLLNALKTGVDRVTDIVKSLNQFSRNNKSNEEECNIHSIIDNCLTMINNRIKHKIDIEKKYFSDNIIIKGNVGNLHQLFINLLTNAEQAILVNGKIIIETKIINNMTIIEIRDTGIGIEKENIHRITDPFYTTKAPGEGTGLGLSISYTIVKEHGGFLEFESEINLGTTARVILPYC